MADLLTEPALDEPPPEEPEEPAGRRGLAARLAAVTLEQWITFAIVAGCVVFTLAQLSPSKLLSDTTPAGGDMGAHVWGPAYLRDVLLPSGRLTGWTPDWYAGFPAFQFYMVIPALAIALLSYVVPYGVAFKLVAVSGVVTLPVAAWAFGRLSRLAFPAPALLSVAAVLFLFDRSFSIYGGNIPSTLAGEFAFSISLSFALLYLGVLARGLETGRYRGWAALLLALTGLCHLIPLIFALTGTVVWLLVRPGKGRLVYEATVVPIGGALTAFWTVPFFLRRGYLNDMGWEKIESDKWRNYLLDRGELDPQLINAPDLRWVLAFAVIGLLLSLVHRRRAGLFLAVMTVLAAVGFVLMPQGRLWNARLLPFYYLTLYLLAAVGIAELGRLLAALFARDLTKPVRWVTWVTAAAGVTVGLLIVAMPLRILPGGSVGSDGVYRWGPFSTTDDSYVDSWADWNFTGYEGYELVNGVPTYKKSYPEYRDLMLTMEQVGQEQGCGRAMWEHEEQHDRYGTPMALMLLPFWTNGCIGSMEGLYFEASATTPYHFIDQDELSTGPSNAQRDLPYGPGPPTAVDFDRGIAHLQLMGVRYYLAISDGMKTLADAHPDLVPLASSGPWNVYEVVDAPLVQSLSYEPAVLVGQSTTGREWQDTAVCWYVQPAAWDVPLAADGPPEWQRVERTVEPSPEATPRQQCEPGPWGWFDGGDGPERRGVTPVDVTNVVEGTDTISFDVSAPGTPVLVKSSYFPNWKVSGAEGPYRVTPNLMVVVPTDTHVELSYGVTGVDLLAWALTLLGIVGLVWLFRARPVTMAPPGPFFGRAERPDLYPSPDYDHRFPHESPSPGGVPPDLAALVLEPLDLDGPPLRDPDDVLGAPPEAGLIPSAGPETAGAAAARPGRDPLAPEPDLPGSEPPPSTAPDEPAGPSGDEAAPDT